MPTDSFIPEGTGNVIGQNTAATQTAIEATEEATTANTTPFHSESPDPEDKIGPMSMAAETEKKNCGCGQDPCKTYGADGYEKSRSQSDEDDDEDIIEGALEDEEANDVPQGFDPTDQDAVQFTDGNIMSPTKMESEGDGGVGYAIEPDHWMRLQAHPEWQETREEVNVERENNFWVITASSETADDLLELILETSDVDTSMDTVRSTGINTGLTLGIGVLGIAASIMLLRRFNKE